MTTVAVGENIVPRRVKTNLAYSARIESCSDIRDFAELLLQYLDQANRDDRELVCEIWLER